MTAIQPVVLCGGSGTRLWPLSRKALPKQFAPLLEGKSLRAIVKGTARVVRDGSAQLVQENESIYIPTGAIYRLENPGKTMLEVVEVQTGSYPGDGDIVRFKDDLVELPVP